jgi:putative ABC transport system permease protein
VSTGLVRQALRRHRWSLLAPACTQVLSSCVISAMVMLAWSLSPAQLSARDRAVVVASQMDDVTSVFLGSAVYLSILIVGVTMNLGIQQQLEDVALVRVVGATPGQVRRAVALQVAVLALPASAVGWLLAVPSTAGWTYLLRTHGVLPSAARLSPNVVALPIAAGVVLSTSVVGAMIAASRTARIRPSSALAEAQTRRRPIGRLRITVATMLVLGGASLSVVLSQLDPQQAGDSALFVMLAECVGVGLLVPIVLRRAAVLLRRVARDGVPRLAVDSIETMSRPLSGALIPLVLAGAFAAVKVGMHTTTTHVTGVAESAADVWTDYSGTVIYVVFAAVAGLNCLITIVVNRRRELATMQLLGGSRRTVITMVLMEAGVITATATVLAIVVAGVTLASMLHGAVGRWLPYFPPAWPLVAIGVLACLVAVGMAAPATVMTRAAPVDILAADQ